MILFSIFTESGVISSMGTVLCRKRVVLAIHTYLPLDVETLILISQVFTRFCGVGFCVCSSLPRYFRFKAPISVSLGCIPLVKHCRWHRVLTRLISSHGNDGQLHNKFCRWVTVTVTSAVDSLSADHESELVAEGKRHFQPFR